MIIDHTHKRYQIRWENSAENKYNGAYYYSQEIVKNIIPRIQTTRNWVTINIPGECRSHSIVFIHNNLNTDRYNWIEEWGFKDLILVCGIPETCEKMKRLGTPIYLPLSIDLEYVMQFKAAKTKEVCYAGRKGKKKYGELPTGIDYIQNMKREDMLRKIATYKEVYAVGRTAIEAKALGCKILPYDSRYPDTDLWQVIDNREAAMILQTKLDEIDR